MRRVAITGLGAISALGHDVSSFWQALREGRSGIRRIESVDAARLRFPNGAEVPRYDAQQFFPNGAADALDPFAQFALIAAREAVRDSGLPTENAKLGADTAVVTGSCIGGQSSQEGGFVE